MRPRARLTLAVWLALTTAAAAQTVSADRLSVGGSKLRPDSSTTVRLDGLATSGTGTTVLFGESDGDVFRRVLATGDIPTVFGRTDTTNTWSLLQTFSNDIAVNGGDITSTSALTLRPSGALTLDPTGDVVLSPDGADVLPNAGYAVNLGALTSKFLTLHAAELVVETLVAQDTAATIGGRLLIGPTTLLTADLSAGATTIQVKHNTLANGDRVYLEANGQVEFLAITSGASGSAGAYTYSATRNLDGSGANAWAAGDALFNTGQTGSGWIDLYSVRGMKSATEYGPTIVGNVRLSSTYNDWAPRWAIGNLDGLYGVSGTTYGVALGNPAEANTLQTANTWKLRDGTTDKLVLDGATGNMTLTGSLVLSTGGSVTSTGQWSLTNSSGLLFDDTSSDTDYVRMLRWSSGSFVRGAGATMYLKTGLAFDGGYGAIFLQGSASTGGEVGFTSYDGVSTSGAAFQANSSGGSTLLAGNLLPWNGSSNTDGSAVIGTSSTRYDNINLALDPNSSPAFVIVNKGGGGADQFSALGYIIGSSGTKTVRYQAGTDATCTLIFTVGLLTGGTC